ncbi:MAG: DNA-directed RNA polymerase subunit H [Candidatus Caldarchaeum sp.]|nr:DNA-directed RNA polymerase subunit H [Candidatus Caldarchaeum sp.]MDW8062966.1 DNA-directed RNA polymerase subunit H [Candidatus Caldarchaeum sp.]
MVKKEKEMPKTDFDIAEHVLVPKHEVLSEEEAEELLKRLGVSRDKIPYILPNDPMVKRLGAKAGDIIKITRKSLTAGEAVYYRVVWGES